MHQLARIIAVAAAGLALGSGCGRQLSEPGSQRTTGGLGSVTITVDGKPLRFEQAGFEFKENPFCGCRQLAIAAGQAGNYSVMLSMDTDAKQVTELHGQGLTKDWGNTERTFSYNYDTYVKDGDKRFLGYKAKAVVTSATEQEVALDLEGTFLEFHNVDQEEPGREVPVKASLRVPRR